jgi:hypothetical protein
LLQHPKHDPLRPYAASIWRFTWHQSIIGATLTRRGLIFDAVDMETADSEAWSALFAPNVEFYRNASGTTCGNHIGASRQATRPICGVGDCDSC